MKKFLIGLLACVLAASAAHAQSTKAQLNTAITSTFIDNNVGAITPAGLRSVTSSIVNSIMPTSPVVSGNLACFNGTTGLLQDCGVGPTSFFLTLSGDCTATSSGVITCLKTNGTPFGSMAAQNANSVAILGGTITGMPNPTSANDVANKSYVDSVAAGLVVLPQTALATAAILPNSPTYANGASGVGATLTAGSNTTLTVDGTAAPLSTVVLVKNQASAFQNGVYTVTQAGSGAAPWILTRATYFDQAAEMKAGSYTFITSGVTLANSAWTLQTAVATVGTDSLTWLLFSQASAGVASGGAVIASRTLAAALNLSTFTTITTQGYALPGDGGGATFKKVSGATPFIDSYITTFTITGGSGYTNGGPYYGNLFSVGTKPFAIGTVTVSGGAFTAVNVDGTPGGQCAVGDVLLFVGSSAAVGGVNGGMPAGGSGGAITVTGCSTPLASFTDSAGNRFQIVTSTGTNILQFGAKGDWNGTDAGTTDNFNAIQAAYWYAGFKSSTSFDSGGFWGGRVDIPQGSYMVCGTGLKPLIVANGVASWGAHGTASTIKFCGTWDATTTQIELGDPNWHFACFNSSLYHMELRSDSGTAYMVHSNCGQDFAGVYQTYIYSNGAGARPCLHYEKGFGGATVFVIRDVSCSANSNSAMFRLGNTIASGMNLGSTMVEVTNVSSGGNSGSSGNHQTATSLLINGGFVNVNRYHFEATGGGITVDVGATGNADHITITNVNGGGLPVFAPCAGVITLTGGNIAGNTTLSQIQASGTCTNTVNNGQGGGVSYAPGIKQPAVFDPSFHSF